VSRRRRVLLFPLLLALAVPTSVAWGQAKVRVNWTAVSGTQSGLWLAYEEGIFKRNGVDVELTHIPSSSRAIQAMLAGEIAFSAVDVANAVEADLKGADVVMLAATTNRLIFSLMARPEIKTVADLKDKTVGITRIGSSTHTASLIAFAEAGLKPGEYRILPLHEVPNILAALLAGQIDAGIVSPPTNSRARKAGLNELRNLAVDGPEYPSVALGSTRAYVKAHEDVTRRVVRSYVEAVHLFKTNKPVAIKVLQKYTKVSDGDVLEETYAQFKDYLESVPRVSRKGLERILADLRAKDPSVKPAQADDFLDERFLSGLEIEGRPRR
jgi:NitT/TauT family transport system substrate-binding protein